MDTIQFSQGVPRSGAAGETTAIQRLGEGTDIGRSGCLQPAGRNRGAAQTGRDILVLSDQLAAGARARARIVAAETGSQRGQ